MSNSLDLFGVAKVFDIIGKNTTPKHCQVFAGFVSVYDTSINNTYINKKKSDGGQIYFNKSYSTFIFKYQGVYYTDWDDIEARKFGTKSALGRQPYLGNMYITSGHLHIYSPFFDFVPIDLGATRDRMLAFSQPQPFLEFSNVEAGALKSSISDTSDTGGEIVYNTPTNTFVLRKNGLYYKNWGMIYSHETDEAERYGTTSSNGRVPYPGALYVSAVGTLYFFKEGKGLEEIASTPYVRDEINTINYSALDSILVLSDRSGEACLLPALQWKKQYDRGMQAPGNVIGIVLCSGNYRLTISLYDVEEAQFSYNSPLDYALNGECGLLNNAINDFDGEDNTINIIANENSTNSGVCASQLCREYERITSYGNGLVAGEWYSPSLGEMVLILSNIDKINAVLSMIPGAENISGKYWTSSEASDDEGWGVWTTKGDIRAYGKGEELISRPVSSRII